MPSNVKSTSAAAVSTASAAVLSAHDTKAAKALKASVKEVLMRVRFGAPISTGKPTFKNGHWADASGARLVPVTLTTPPAGSADMPSTTALVNPKTNQFFHLETGGFTGQSFFHGPMQLPNDKGFTSRAFSVAAYKEIEALANGKKTTVSTVNVSKLPTSLLGPNANAQVTSSFFVDMMPGPGTASRKAVATIELFGNGFNDAPPAYKVTKLEVYEKGTNKLVASQTNPKATEKGTHGRGQVFNDFRAEIPVSKLDLSKQYTVVLTVGINNAAPKQVRSDYSAISRAF